MRNIQRVDHNYFHGWAVRLKRRGAVRERYFADGPDRNAAFARAQRWRDRMEALLPPPRKFKSRNLLNTTGVVGVSFGEQRSRKGTLLAYYRAAWTDEAGRTHSRRFSVAKYGKTRARSLAVKTRQEALAEMLVPKGLAATSGRRRRR